MNMIKIASGHVSVAYKLKQKKRRQNNMCPYCGEKETVDHLFRCNSELVKEKWDKSIGTIKAKAIKIKTKITIINSIVEHLNKWRDNVKKSKTQPMINRYNKRKKENKAARKQKEIGWRQFFFGKIAKDWGDLQQEHYKRQRKKKTRKQWTVKMIKIIWEQTQRYWNVRCKFAHSELSVWNRDWKIKCIQQVNKEYSKGLKELKGKDARWWKTKRKKISR